MAYPTELTTKFAVLADPEQSLRTQIDDIISSYNSPWDPLTELIQNSVDAINLRRSLEGANFTTGKIKIVVDAAKATLTVEDNGAGIPKGYFDHLLIPGGTLKRNGNTYGHKGLGFTYCAHVAKEIEVETTEIQTNESDHWKFTGGFDWVNDPSNAPTLDLSVSPSIRTMQGPGTAVRVKFAVGVYEQNKANTAVLDKFFTWADDEKLLPFVIRTRTAIGQVFDLFGKTPSVDIEVNVELTNGGRSFDVPYKFFDFYNFPPLSASAFGKASDYATNVYANPAVSNKVHYGIYHLFDSDKSKNPPDLKVGTHHGGVKFEAYLYCCGKDNLATALGQYDSRLNNEFRYLSFSTDVHLAIDGMPCGVPIDSWNNFGGFEQRYFCIVNTDLSFGKVLDAGRKTITRHYVDLFTEKIVELTKSKSYFPDVSFFQLAQQLHHTTSSPTVQNVSQLIAYWSALPPLPTQELLLSVLPDDELAVYLLFAELVGRGLLKGYKVKYVSASAPYDMALSFQVNLADLSQLNSSAGGGSVTGPGSALVQKHGKRNFIWEDNVSGRKHLVAECKVNGAELLVDVQARKTQKIFKDIDLLVCVSIDSAQVSDKSGALHSVPLAAREFSGVTHKLLFSGHEVQVIELSTVLAQLVSAGSL